MNRRQFLQAGLASAATLTLTRAAGVALATPSSQPATFKGPADACILIWLPGGVAQTDTWDPKKHTPYEKGMKGNQIRGTCPMINTAAEGIQLGARMETIAWAKNEGAIVRSLTYETKSGSGHLKAQY